MNTQARKSGYPLLLIAGIAVILASCAGIAVVLGGLPSSPGVSGGIFAVDFPVAADEPDPVAAQTPSSQVEVTARARSSCAECGVVVSARAIEAQDEGAGFAASGEPGLQAARGYEITIRLADQSRRVLTHASPESWRPGERVIVIDGANASHR